MGRGATGVSAVLSGERQSRARVKNIVGLRIEDLMVRIPPGTAANAREHDGFIEEVKVNGSNYSDIQQYKDALIGSGGGTLLTPVLGYRLG